MSRDVAVMEYFIGTSGFAYPAWRGSFYPAKFPTKDMLSYYAERFPAVEINNTFYGLPEVSVFEGWARETLAAFQFAIKAPQTITHRKRLKDAEEPTDEFLARIKVLKKRLGPVLFQLPPNMKQDLPRLEAFLKHLKGRVRAAFEFRHSSWFEEPVYDCLRRHDAALCLAEAEDLPPQELVATTDWGYLRLRRDDYTKRTLKRHAATIAEQSWKAAYVFFKHEDTGTGPAWAADFQGLIE
ncbi:MAG: DUF72 domain-containing protein [Pirellulales bacterium]